MCFINAQDTGMFEAFTAKDGLSENVVTCIYQDTKGLLWFGTYDGLNCYDGYHFRIYRHNNKDSLSLPGNHVGNIIQDKEGNLWVVTDKGSGILYPATGKFKTIFKEKTLQPEQVKLFDAGNDKILFLFTKTLLYNKKTRRLNSLYLPEEKEEPYITAAFFFKGNIYAAIRNSGYCSQLGKFDNTKNTFYPAKEFSLKNISDPGCIYIENLFTDAQKRLWISERNFITGGSFLHVININGSKNIINKKFAKFTNRILPVAEEKDGDIWLISFEGWLYRWNNKNQQLDTLTQKKEAYACISAFVDNKDILWVGSKGKGVLKYNLLKSEFRHYTANTSQRKLHRNNILGLFSFDDKYLLAMHEDNVLSKINIGNDAVNVIHSNDLPNAAIYKSKWNHFLKIHDTAGMVSILKRTGNLPYGFPNFIGTPSLTQVLYCNFAGGALRHYDSAQTIILDNISYVWHVWQGDTLWICNETDGLVALHYPEYIYRRYLADAADPFSISSDKTKYILFTPAGNLWVATDDGLNYLDKRTQKFCHYTEKDGLCNNTIYCMAYDKRGRIWLGTGNGLSCFDTAAKKFINFYTTDGLVNSEYNRFSAWLAADGRMFMGGTEGIDYFDPEKLIYNSQPPKVIFSDFTVHNVHFPPEHLPEFNHTQNNVSVFFTTDDYSYPEGNKYLYKLEGADKNWILLQGTNEAHYTLLPPGNYTFKVKAANNRGAWNEKPAELSFTILPPWYNTWWFYVTIVITVTAMVCLFVQSYTKRKLHKQKEMLQRQLLIEKERTRISADLHDEVGGSLSAINLMSELLQQNGMGDKNQLARISASSKELVQKMNEIVWALNTQNDTLTNLLAYLRHYVAEILNDVDIACKITVPDEAPDINFPGDKRRIVFLLVKECINNIIKHSHAAEAKILFELNDVLHISIQDNGKGFCNENIKANSFGINNLKKRAAELQGTIEWKNNGGTTVIICIPLQNISHKSVIM